MSRLSGVFAAIVTPFAEDGAPDAARMARHGRWLLGHGCDGLAVMGTTGEANSLSVSERMTLLDGLAGQGIDPARTLVGVGLSNAPETVALARHAAGHGVGGVLVLPPFYFKRVSDDGLFAHFAAVIEGLGADCPPVYLYHFPAMSAVPLSLDLIARLRDAFPGVVVGVKDSAGDLGNMTAMVERFGPDFAVFSGSDRLAGALVRAGGAGCVTALANLIAPLLSAVVHDPADAEAQAVVEAVRVVFENRPMIPPIKALVAEAMGDPGFAVVRPPQVAAGGVSGLKAALAEAGFAVPDMTGDTA